MDPVAVTSQPQKKLVLEFQEAEVCITLVILKELILIPPEVVK